MNPTLFSRRCLRIYQIGCLPCRQRRRYSPCQVHHLNEDGKAGAKRRGDEFTIGLCPWHHVGEPVAGLSADECRRVIGPSLKHESSEFREEFGSDDVLLAKQNALIAQAERAVVGAR